jgi:hypothetical protein
LFLEPLKQVLAPELGALFAIGVVSFSSPELLLLPALAPAFIVEDIA